MQTFLPYPRFLQSAACLDNKRLGKQRVEVMQILNTILGYSEGWKNHPAVKMWRPYPLALAEYGRICCDEWMSRNKRDNLKFQFDIFTVVAQNRGHKYYEPLFMGNLEFHNSHRSNLLRKYPEWYSQFNWSVSDDLPYVWPTQS